MKKPFCLVISSHDTCHIFKSTRNILNTRIVWKNAITKLIFKENFSMNRNLSNLDRGARIVLAAVLAYLYFSGIVPGTLGIILVVVGVVFLLTAVFAFCPIYFSIKFSTFK